MLKDGRRTEVKECVALLALDSCLQRPEMSERTG